MPLLTGTLRHKYQHHINRVAFDWLLRLFALFNPALKDIIARLGRNKKAGNPKSKKTLNRQPRNHEEAILALSDQKEEREINIHSPTIHI